LEGWRVGGIIIFLSGLANHAGGNIGFIIKEGLPISQFYSQYVKELDLSKITALLQS
jgi:hypothetical protein